MAPMSRGGSGGVLERESQLAALFDYAEDARHGGLWDAEPGAWRRRAP